jgi:hypothetical protein
MYQRALTHRQEAALLRRGASKLNPRPSHASSEETQNNRQAARQQRHHAQAARGPNAPTRASLFLHTVILLAYLHGAAAWLLAFLPGASTCLYVVTRKFPS